MLKAALFRVNPSKILFIAQYHLLNTNLAVHKNVLIKISQKMFTHTYFSGWVAI